MNKVIGKCIIAALSVIIVGIGASLSLKAAVGVSAWSALSQSIATGINIKVGTISMLQNISCVLIQLILLKKEFKVVHSLQVLVSVLLGLIVNFMLYDVLSSVIINNYFINVLLILLGTLLCVVGVSVLMVIDFISFPLEACCMVISKKINIKFGIIRQFVDILSIVFALGIAFIFKESITVREGTIIAMIIFGPMVDLFMKIIMPRLKKLELAY
ncbi:YczE/YyaS/YitT family protein [Clostridium vincentii]|uniref:Membrane protein YczE n=1 Tax=Clostridium vincentii TaxID=52704 RepID=A0A2T0BIR1_9CLOT|nr:hypothetical protein [Clostridium vincentii]PRR83776.1 hypothetical protein CLVI_07230 [Clostridium vincentii]